MKSWRDAASIILATRHKQKLNQTLSPVANYDYKLLSLKRHKESSFLPGNYVFPGGMTESADADLKWQQLFSKSGFDSNSFVSLLDKKNLTHERPYIFRSICNELPREISLRITAIRETFEECGILLCRATVEKKISSQWAEHFQVAQEELNEWQLKVHNDAREFYTMCERLGCYPDLWALHEWSNWLTPAFFPKRFDTIFFMACLKVMPHAVYEAGEMEDLRWDSPKDLLKLSGTMAPPQIYEIGEISKIQQLENLLNIAFERNQIGAELQVGTRVQLLDGQVLLLSGDSMYLENVNSTDDGNFKEIKMSIEEFRNLAITKNRIEFGKKIQVISDKLEINDSCTKPKNSKL